MEEVSIPLSVKLGDISALGLLQRQVEETKRKLTEMGSFEALPGGGIRRRGDARAQPGAGTYAPPSMDSPGSSRVSTPPLPGQPTVTPAEHFVQAVPQANAYIRALGQVDTQTRRLFLSLRDLGQRHREQGFLGKEDTRTLQSTQRAFDTVSRRVESDLQGASARQATARTDTERQRATREVDALRTRQRAMATLERQLPPPPLPPPPAPPTSPGEEHEDEAGPGRFRRGLQRGFQRVQGVARGALGIAAGVGVYQTLTHAMELYEQRAAGVIATGMQLDLGFDRVGSTIDSLRTKYQVLAHDSIQAMQAMGRISGETGARSLERLDRAVRFGAAYNMAPAQAAAMAEYLQRTTVAGSNPLATIAATTRQLGSGITPMSTEARAEEVFSMVQRGASSGLRVPVSQYGREAALIGSIGEQYQVPGAVSNFAGQLSQGLTQSPDVGIYAMRMQALSQLRRTRQAQGLGTKLTRGGHTFDLTSNFDLGALMEVADQVPEVREAYRQYGQQAAGGNTEYQKYLFQDMVGGRQLSRVKSEQLRAAVGRDPRGFNVLSAPATDETAAEEAREGGRLAARARRPEFLHQAVQAQVEGGLEDVGKRMVTLGDELKRAVAELGTAAASGELDFRKLSSTMLEVSSSSRILLGALTALTAANPWQLAAGVALGATGVPGLAGGLPPGTSWLFGGGTSQEPAPRYNLGVPPPSLQPQKPGP